jgi:signal recognition particle subunit SRP54
MFDNLSDRLSKTLNSIRGRGRLTDENIKDTLREVRMALLEADVALPVVREVVKQIKTRAIGQDVSKSLTPGQEFIKVVQHELEVMMGEINEDLDLKAAPPAVILMAGLQGAGKTTSVAKLAKFLIEKKKKKVLVVSADVYRPAAIKQLETLAQEVQADFFPSSTDQKPLSIATSALDHAKKKFFDVLIVDTAGRLHVDLDMMDEVRQLHAAINPIETLFVVDAMTGQDAANTAKAFNEALPLTGVVLTKIDGDARGGAALSIRQITGKPIKFMGVGEKTEALEPFHPDRIASRILGMGDMLSLIEEVEQHVDKEKAQKMAQKLQKGQGFSLEDFRDQLQQMDKMGGMMGMLEKMPGMKQIPTEALAQVQDNKMFKSMEAMINSMTPHERHFPEVIKASRKRRIATGSGTTVQEVNKLLKQFTQMQKMMKKFSKKGNMSRMLKQFGGQKPKIPGL